MHTPGGLGYWNHLHVVQAGSTALCIGYQEFQTMPFFNDVNFHSWHTQNLILYVHVHVHVHFRQVTRHKLM